MNRRNIVILLFLLLLLCIMYFIFSRNRVVIDKGTGILPGTINVTPQENPVNENIIKCQNVVVTPEITTELFTYVSGKKVRMDYRMSATSEEKSGNHQAFYDGEWLYIWDRGVNDLAPVDGMKSRVGSFAINSDVGTLGEVKAFKGGKMSGDRMCNTWDDVDPVFDVPKNVTFVESADVIKIWQERLYVICEICGQVPDEEAPSVCQKNLSCK